MSATTSAVAGQDAARWWVLPLVLVAVALALPVAPVAGAIRGPNTAMGDVVVGVRLLKGMLVALALAVAAVNRMGAAAARRARSPHAVSDRAATGTRSLLMLGVVLTVAAALRLPSLDSELWLDEIDTLFDHVRLPFLQILGTYTSQNQHPLYSLFAHASWLASGGADWSIRIPALVFGVASIGAAYAFARRVTSEAEAWLAALVLAFSYHHVWFSQNARGYTQMLFLALIASTLMVQLLRGESRHPAHTAWGYAAATALASYTHLTAVLIGAGHAAAILVLQLGRRREDSPRFAWPMIGVALSAVITLCLYSVVLPQVGHQLLATVPNNTTLEWMKPRWLAFETIRVLASGVPGGLITMIVALGVLGVGAVSYWRTAPIVLLVMLLPVAVTGATVMVLQHNLWPRFFFFASAFFVMLAVRGGFRIAHALFGARGERVAIAGGIGVACLSLTTVPRAWQPKQQYQRAAEYVDRTRAPGDRVVAIDVAAYVYGRYPERSGWTLTASLDSLRAVEHASPRTWVIYTFPTRLRSVAPALAEHVLGPAYRERQVFGATVGDGEIHVLVQDAGGSDD